MYIIKNKIILAGGVIIALLFLSFLIYFIFVNNTASSDEANAGTVSFTSGEEQRSLDNTSSPDEEYYSSATFQGTAILGECPIPPELLDKYKDTTIEFEYEIKSSYSSREDIQQELYIMGKCFDEYTLSAFENKNYKLGDAVLYKYDEMRMTLEEELKKFPLSNEEIKQRRINEFYSFHDIKETIYKTAEAKFNATGDVDYKREYEENKAIYDEEEIVRKDYEAGKITIEEALIRIGRPEYAEGTEELD